MKVFKITLNYFVNSNTLSLFRCAGIGIFLCSFLASLLFAEPPSAPGNLEAVKALKIENGSIQSVENVDKPVSATPGRTADPHICLKVLLNPAKGSNINVEIWLPLPDKWNGSLIGAHDTAADFGIDTNTLLNHCKEGYATVACDLGVEKDGKNAVGNPEAWKDYGYRATHLMTVLAKQAINAYYGKPPQFSYYLTEFCAGELGLQEAQRYPEDYDGITIAQPYQTRPLQQAYLLWNQQIMGKCALTTSQKTAFVQACRDFFAPRQVPALSGTYVVDSRITTKDIDGVIALTRQKDPTLTDAQADGLRKLLDGPHNPKTGDRIYFGMPPGSDFVRAGHASTFLLDWFFAGKKSRDEINFAEDMDGFMAALGPYLNAENPDLTAFQKRGGKLMITVWASDPNAPILETLDYYERVVAQFGGDLTKVRSFFTVYVIPGTAHAPQSVSPGRSMLKVMDWREKGTMPGIITCHDTQSGKPTWAIPFSPYPAETIWDAKANSYQMADGLRGVAEPVAKRYFPAPKE